MGFFTLENGTEMNILEMVCAKEVAYLNLENEGIIHDFSQKIIEEAEEVAAYNRFFSENISRKGRNRKAQRNGKRNADKAKCLHKQDRKHGKSVPQSDKKYWDEQSGTFYRWDEKRETFSSPKKPIVHRKRKTFRDRLNSAMSARELDYTSDFSEKGELMDKVEFLDEAISFGEREIENLEYEKAFGYLSDRGDIVIEECKRNLSELKDYKRDILRVIRTATR